MAKPRSLLVTMLLVFSLLPIASLSLISRVSAAAPGIKLTTPRDISSSPTKAVYPAVALDTKGFIHVAWLEYTADNSSSRVLYTNNIGGDFFSAYEVAGGGGTNAEHILAIAVETNRVHVFFTGSGSKPMRHRIVRLDGATPTRAEITTLSPGTSKGYAPSATVDSNGRVHAAWIDNRSGTYQIYHRIWANGNWESSDRAVRPDGAQQDRPTLAATSDGRVHVLYAQGSSAQYSILNGTTWQRGNSPGGGGKSTNSIGLAADGNTVFAVWSVTRNDNVHVINYNKSDNGNWGTTQTISPAGEYGDNPSAFFNKANGKLYAVWSSGTSRTISLREISPDGGLSDVIVIGRGPSNWPMGAGGTGGVAIVWQDKSSGQEEIMVSAATTSVTPPKPIGSVAVVSEFTPLLGGVGVVGSFDATVTNTGGSATSVTLTPEGGTVKTAIFVDKSSKVTGLSFAAPVKACEQKTIRGTLTGPGGTSDEFSTTVFVDGGVDASATQVVEIGDPAYAKGPFKLRIASGVDECSGLKSYSVDFPSTPITPDVSGDIFVTGDVVEVPLPIGNDGVYAYAVTILDRAGNAATYQQSITKDTIAPVARLESGQTIPVTETGPDGFIDLNMSVLKADDAYPDRGNGQHFYSIELLTKKTGADAPTNAEWNAKGVGVVGPIPATLHWNVAMGLIGEFAPGQYTLYVRVLDGAGNASNAFATTPPIQVDTLNGRLFLPSLSK